MTDTTGEKDFEEFTAEGDILDGERFKRIGVIKAEPRSDARQLNRFPVEMGRLCARGIWTKQQRVDLFPEMIPEFQHAEKNKSLDDRM